jgi:hypothetical protein
MDTNFFISGDDPQQVPDDYFSDQGFASQVAFQTRKIEAHIRNCDDDYIPVLFPWYGTVVVQSAVGSRVLFPDKDEPAIDGSVLNDPAEVRNLRRPDPNKDGLMPRVLGCIDYMREHSEYPVAFTDPQGPLSIAIGLCGLEQLCYWMYDCPVVVHELMDFCTTVLIDWITVQKQHAGQELDSGAWPHGFIALPKGYGGVGVSDDDCTIMPPSLYKEFAVPYLSRVFEAFGGGTLHYCGSANQQLENFRAIRGLTGINNYCLGDFRSVRRTQDALGDRIAIMVCDYAPIEIEDHFRSMLECLDRTGIIIGTYPAAQDALSKGRVVRAPRDPNQVGADCLRTIRTLLSVLPVRPQPLS